MFGREARLPVDLCFSVSRKGEGDDTYQQYVAQLRNDLHRAYQLAAEAAEKTHERNKKAHDQLVKEQVLFKGDCVLIKNFNSTGKHKLRSKCKAMPYIVVRKMENLPVYQVQPEGGAGGIKTVHRNHLLPIGYLVRVPVDTSESHSSAGRETRLQQKLRKGRLSSCAKGNCRTQKKEGELTFPDSEDSSDELDGYSFVISDTDQSWRDLLQHSCLLARGQAPVADESQTNPSVNCSDENAGMDDITCPTNMAGTETLPSTDPISMTLLEDGAVTDGGQESVEGETMTERPRREKRPVIRLSYDELGVPSNQPLNTLSLGVLVGYGTYGHEVDCPVASCQDREAPKTKVRQTPQQPRSCVGPLMKIPLQLLTPITHVSSLPLNCSAEADRVSLVQQTVFQKQKVSKKRNRRTKVIFKNKEEKRYFALLSKVRQSQRSQVRVKSRRHIMSRENGQQEKLPQRGKTH
ncbi:hypothetical protein AOLI_G00249460 [Acnodon oligacanthus]